MSKNIQGDDAVREWIIHMWNAQCGCVGKGFTNLAYVESRDLLQLYSHKYDVLGSKVKDSHQDSTGEIYN